MIGAISVFDGSNSLVVLGKSSTLASSANSLDSDGGSTDSLAAEVPEISPHSPHRPRLKENERRIEREQHHAMVDWHCVCYCAELEYDDFFFSIYEEYFVRARHVIIKK